MIYVDENGRVYQNWESYVTENELPEGIMVAPRRGIYNLTMRGDVILESYQTPAGSLKNKAIGVLDKIAAVGGIAAACVLLTGLATPVAKDVMTLAGTVALASVGYKTVRSINQLVDRHFFEQSINVTDRTALNHWLVVILGLGASATLIEDLKLSNFTQMTANIMNVSSLLIAGTTNIIFLFMKHQNGGDIPTMDAFSLSLSLGQSSKIINDNLNDILNAYTPSGFNRRTLEELVKPTEIYPVKLEDIITCYRLLYFRSIFNLEDFKTVLRFLEEKKEFREEHIYFILQLTSSLTIYHSEELNKALKLYISAELVLYKIGTHILDNYSGLTAAQLEEQYGGKIVSSVYFYFVSLNPIQFPHLLKKCKKCNGLYSICNL